MGAEIKSCVAWECCLRVHWGLAVMDEGSTVIEGDSKSSEHEVVTDSSLSFENHVKM